MQTLGIDLFATARAVLIESDGRVVGRGSAGGGDAVAAARMATGGARADLAGVALPPGETGPTLDAVATRIQTVSGGAAVVTAESWIGAAQGAKTAISLWIGERVFAGILLDGRPWTGAHGIAGAAAWLALNPVERQDYRKLGSLSAEVSVKGIARRLSWRIQAGDHSAVLERAGDLDAITAAHVFEGARAGDGVAISVVRDTAKYIGMAVANLASTIDPEVVVIGGEVAGASDLLADAVRQECSRRLPPGAADVLRVEFSTLGDDAVAIGAARLVQAAE